MHYCSIDNIREESELMTREIAAMSKITQSAVYREVEGN